MTPWVSLACYSLACIILWFYVRQTERTSSLGKTVVIILCSTGLAAHLSAIYPTLLSSSGLTYSLTTSLSIISATSVLFYVLISIFQRALNLGVVILPISIVALFLSLLLHTPNTSASTFMHSSAITHLLLATVNAGVMVLVFAQAVVFLVQERQLQSHSHIHNNGFFFPHLPALQTMEQILFQLIRLSFILLSFNLIIGILLNNRMYGQLLLWDHHTLLIGLAWLGFAALWLGKILKGWRGQTSAKMTLIIFTLFILGYIGPKIVSELILNT